MATSRITPRAQDALKNIGRHIVFYLITNQGINIIGIPHKDMDIISYFQLD